ncbi:Hypothetical predicted protein [Paramuricea clavata]|uniref:Uncharacterized protein n=1 Tax=Paramuricea clavata TaxID=317549 RepID=A0A7D9ILR6_PARCT|nr:Hypothetical predicted protein [Paramuricea clavata]
MATAKLRKENQQLREEIEELQGNLKQITADISKKNESLIEQDGRHASQSTESTADKDKSLEKCEVIANAVEQIENYNYQYNIKITGMPQQNPNESADETGSMCLKLCTAIGADVSIYDVDIAHRVPARRQSNRSNAIICKFVRRLAKEKVIVARKQTSNVQPEQLHRPRN